MLDHALKSDMTTKPVSGEHIGFDQLKDRPDGKGSSAHLVSQRRDREIDPLAFEALALPIQRLMLTELLVEQDRRQKLGADIAPWRRMERCRRLRDRLAVLDDVRVCLSNIAAERGLRGIALGQKSWLFCGSDRGGPPAAEFAYRNSD